MRKLLRRTMHQVKNDRRLAAALVNSRPLPRQDSGTAPPTHTPTQTLLKAEKEASGEGRALYVKVTYREGSAEKPDVTGNPKLIVGRRRGAVPEDSGRRRDTPAPGG